MKAMLLADFAVMRKYQPQQVAIALVVGTFVGIMTESPYIPLTVVCVSVAFSLIFSLLALDERNGWESYRLALPLSRRSIMQGRYASILIIAFEALALGFVPVAVLTATGVVMPDIPKLGAMAASFDVQAFALLVAASLALTLVMFAITLPLNARFGMTKAVRYVPLVLACAIMILFGVSAVTDTAPTIFAEIDAFASTPEGALITTAATCLAGLVVYTASYVLSIRFYEKREF